ncbi:MAG: dTMP kinase, partial [Candidatus Cybelea sp.]
SGKSTLLAGVAARLRAEGQDVVETREPGGTPVGDAVREIFLNRAIAISALTESLLVNAARAQHVSAVIRPALASGKIVLSDRFTDSTIAYQGNGRGVDGDLLRALCEIATGGLEPDLVLLLDLPLTVARSRLSERTRARDRIETEDDTFHERVRRGFLDLARSPRHRLLDATLPPERLVESALQEILGMRVR